MKSPVIQGLNLKLFAAFSALVAVMVVGTIGYKLLAGDKYSWFDGFYMTFITVATIGYGEIIDLSLSPGGHLFTVIIGTAGLATLWFMFSTLTVMILEGDINLALRRRRMEKIIKKLDGHYIVCGFGRVGRNVAAELEATDRRYVAIEEDMLTLEEQKEKNPSLLYLHGDASDDDVLVSADIKDAKGVFAVTGDDSRNLMITLTAKQLNPAVRVVARCHEMRNAVKLRKARCRRHRLTGLYRRHAHRDGHGATTCAELPGRDAAQRSETARGRSHCTGEFQAAHARQSATARPRLRTSGAAPGQ